MNTPTITTTGKQDNLNNFDRKHSTRSRFIHFVVLCLEKELNLTKNYNLIACQRERERERERERTKRQIKFV